jgi:hypothetical protein
VQQQPGRKEEAVTIVMGAYREIIMQTSYAISTLQPMHAALL